MKRLLVALVVLTASMFAAGGVASAGAATAESQSLDGPVLQSVDDLQSMIEQIDDLLESIVDLQNTLEALFGEGGESGD
jgi:TolA-binding protein